jgi:hypothetical protein
MTAITSSGVALILIDSETLSAIAPPSLVGDCAEG